MLVFFIRLIFFNAICHHQQIFDLEGLIIVHTPFASAYSIRKCKITAKISGIKLFNFKQIFAPEIMPLTGFSVIRVLCNHKKSACIVSSHLSAM